MKAHHFSLQVLISFFGLLAPFGGLFGVADEAAEPQELIDLRILFQWQLEEAVLPVNEMYVKALDRLQKEHLLAGELNAAIDVLKERQRILTLIGGDEPAEDAPSLVNTFDTPKDQAKEDPETPELAQTTYHPAGTTWVWGSPGAVIHFKENGKADAVLGERIKERNVNFEWERKGPRSFIIRRPDLPHVMILFEILRDGNTAVYSNMSGSQFKMMVARIP